MGHFYFLRKRRLDTDSHTKSCSLETQSTPQLDPFSDRKMPLLPPSRSTSPRCARKNTCSPRRNARSFPFKRPLSKRSALCMDPRRNRQKSRSPLRDPLLRYPRQRANKRNCDPPPSGNVPLPPETQPLFSKNWNSLRSRSLDSDGKRAPNS